MLCATSKSQNRAFFQEWLSIYFYSFGQSPLVVLHPSHNSCLIFHNDYIEQQPTVCLRFLFFSATHPHKHTHTYTFIYHALFSSLWLVRHMCYLSLAGFVHVDSRWFSLSISFFLVNSSWLICIQLLNFGFNIIHNRIFVFSKKLSARIIAWFSWIISSW